MQRESKFFAKNRPSLSHSKKSHKQNIGPTQSLLKPIPQGAAAAEGIGKQMLKTVTGVSPTSL